MGDEFDVDPRVALAAYQTLAEEGLVVLKPRSGVYVAPATAPSDERPPCADFLADMLVAAVVRGFSLSRFTDDLRIAALGRRLRVAVVAATPDQALGLSRELKVDYGFETTTLLCEELKQATAVRSAIQRAHLVITTGGLEKEVSNVAERFGKQVMVVDIRPPFVENDWKALLRSGRAYVVATDARFLEILRSHLEKVVDLRNVRMLIAGRDDLATIPPQAPTYVTEAARQKLGKFRIPGRLIPPPRLLAENSVRTLVAFIVKMNLEQAQS